MAPEQTTQHLTVGERLRLARERSGWSVSDFANKIQMHRNNIPRWEARNAEPSFSVLRLYAENCRGTTEEWLAFEIGDWPPLGGPNGDSDGSGFFVGKHHSNLIPFPGIAAARPSFELAATG